MRDDRNKDPFLFAKIFGGIADSELTPALVRVKQAGYVITMAGIVSFMISWLLDDSAPSDQYFEQYGLIGIAIGFALFAVIALYSSGRRRTGDSHRSAMFRSFFRIALFIYLPAIIITAILVYFFVFLYPTSTL